jgi:hypothetical protein
MVHIIAVLVTVSIAAGLFIYLSDPAEREKIVKRHRDELSGRSPRED